MAYQRLNFVIRQQTVGYWLPSDDLLPLIGRSISNRTFADIG